MKILIATNSYPTEKNPTHQVFIRNIYEGLQKEGLNVDLVYNHYFDYFKSDLETGNFFSSVFKTVFLFFSYLPKLLFSAGKYDFIYSHAPVWPGFFMLIAQKLHGTKHVTYVHGSVNHYVKKAGLLYQLANFTMKRCDSVVTNSRYMVDRLKKEYNCESTIITPGYNDSIFTYQSGPRSTDLFFAGSTLKRKGIRLLLNAITNNRIFYEENNLTIKMHFSGGLKEEYIRYAELNGIDDLIEFGDRLTEEDLANRFKNSKVFVFPSTEEPLGLVGMEAIACGAVLAGSDSGGIKEYLQDGKNGFLFRDGDADDLQHAIERSLKSFSEFENKQPQISKSVSEFSIKEALRQTVSLFKKLNK